jgi:hypothetical protein
VLHKLGRAKRQEQRCQTAHPEENLRQRSHSPYTFIGHSRHRDPTKHPRRSSLPVPPDPRPRTGQQSIPIGHALGNGLVQPIFRPPSRRPPSDCSPSVFRRDARLKMLCVMFYSRTREKGGFACHLANYLAHLFAWYLAYWCPPTTKLSPHRASLLLLALVG